MDCILTFDSIHRVMKAEKILLGHHVTVRLIPTPRYISPDCGMAVQIQAADVEQARKLLREGSVEIAGIHTLEESKGEMHV